MRYLYLQLTFANENYYSKEKWWNDSLIFKSLKQKKRNLWWTTQIVARLIFHTHTHIIRKHTSIYISYTHTHIHMYISYVRMIENEERL